MQPRGRASLRRASQVVASFAASELNAIAAQNGGTVDINPLQDHGFMYNRNLAELDDHLWEMFWMDLEAMPG